MGTLVIRRRAPRMKVFLADDSKTFIDRFTRLVTDLPEVELVGKAVDVPGAIRGIRNLLPDAVIVDLHMPGGTGIDIIYAAKRFRSTTTVIVLTNSSYPQYRARCQAGRCRRILRQVYRIRSCPRSITGTVGRVPPATRTSGDQGQGSLPTCFARRWPAS